MLTYLSEVKDWLTTLLAGMKKFAAKWTDQTVPVSEVEQMIAKINSADSELEDAKKQLTIKQTAAREVSAEASKLAGRIENFALGFHSANSSELLEYNIKEKKAKEPKPAPAKTLIPILEDDTDGEGFIVSTQTDPNADYYEWQKGTGTNAADANTIPELKNFKTTKKTSFVDDEVSKGVRTFYRVRAANTNGVGPWSEAVSRVQ